MYQLSRVQYNFGKYRVAAGLSQVKVAALMGIEPSVICRWESNQRCPSLTYAAEYARVIGVTLDELIRP